MANLLTTSVVRQIGSLFDRGSVAGLSDRQLLDRFATGPRDAVAEAAFAALVARHGPMVLHVCRQLLGDHQHAEDAFQAVFLVLARRARSIGNPDLLGNWLHGVALRTARKARGRLARQRKHEEDRTMRPRQAGSTVPADQAAAAREQAGMLHDEIDRLPGLFRSPVVLCYLEGLSLDEAARRLGCPAGTVHSRLVRARDKLRRGLTRRGVALSAAAMAAVLEVRPASASISSSLCDMTTRAAISFAAGQAAAPVATAVAREVLRSMFMTKLKLGVMTLLFLGAFAAGAGFVGQAPARQTGKPVREERQAGKPDLHAAPGRMTVVGRVLDPAGKPVPNASVMVYARLKQFAHPAQRAFLGPPVTDSGRCEESGRFRIDAARTASSRNSLLVAVALAPGYAMGWVELDPDADQPNAEIALQPEQIIQGRLFDVQGRPVPRAAIVVRSISLIVDGRMSTDEPLFRPDYFDRPTMDFPAWPGPAISDDAGRFTLRGLGHAFVTIVTVDHERGVLPPTLIQTDHTIDPRDFGLGLPATQVETGPNARPLTLALQPARTVSGRVTYADTGQPVPHARLLVWATPFQADGEGRFRATMLHGREFGSIAAQAADGLPYLNVSKRFNWPKGAVQHTVDLALPRGVVVRGKIAEEGTGKPITGAIVSFTPYDSARANNQEGHDPTWSVTDADGAFQVVAPAGPGYLVVQGPSDDYVLREFGAEGGRFSAKPGHRRFYAHAYTFLDVKPESHSQHVNLTLRPGVTISGRVLGPDGQPVQEAWIFSRVILHEVPSGGWKTWNVNYGRGRGQVHDGRFALHGLGPDEEVPAYFIEPKREWGAAARFSARSAAAGPPTVRLEPCGTATARLVGPDGKPLGQYTFAAISMVVTPGPPFQGNQAKQGVLFANETRLDEVAPSHYQIPRASDAQGRIAFPALIPGATFRIIDPTAHDAAGRIQIRKEFTVKPGETLDLGDILIEKPRAQ